MTFRDNPFDRQYDTLEELVDDISETLLCPVTLEDANHRLIAYSSHDPETDDARIATIISRRVPEKVIGMLWRDGIMQKIIESEDPVRIAPITEVGLGGRVAIGIRNQHDLLGFIWVVDGQLQLGDKDLHLLKKAAQAVRTKLVALQRHNRKETQGYQNFFWQLLTGHLNDDNAIRERAHEIKLTLPPSFLVMVLRFTAEIDAKINQQIQYLLSTPHPVKVALQVAERQQAVLLTAPSGGRSIQDDVPAFLSNLSSRLKERLGTIGVEAAGGATYQDYRKVETSYREALSVLQIKRRFPVETANSYLYRELGYYCYLPLLSEHKREHPVENECLRRLRAYDLEHCSDLIQTLKMFLSCNGNVKRASEALHVHTNTMAYRLKRIAEIGDIDLEQMDQIVTLYLELKTEQYGGPEPL